MRYHYFMSTMAPTEVHCKSKVYGSFKHCSQKWETGRWDVYGKILAWSLGKSWPSQHITSVFLANSTYRHAFATKKVTKSSSVAKVSPIEGLLFGDLMDVFLHSVCKMKILIVLENQYEKKILVSTAYQRLMQTKQYQINWHTSTSRTLLDGIVMEILLQAYMGKIECKQGESLTATNFGTSCPFRNPMQVKGFG